MQDSCEVVYIVYKYSERVQSIFIYIEIYSRFGDLQCACNFPNASCWIFLKCINCSVYFLLYAYLTDVHQDAFCLSPLGRFLALSKSLLIILWDQGDFDLEIEQYRFSQTRVCSVEFHPNTIFIYTYSAANQALFTSCKLKIHHASFSH